MSINAKRKGNNGELAFAEWLRSKGVKAYRDSASGGGNGNKSDISTDTDFGFEIKTVKKINLMEAWHQCDTSAGMNKTVPCLAIRFDGMPKDQWLMVLNSEDWAEYVLGNRDVGGNVFVDQKAKYAVQNAVQSLKTVLKHFEV